MVEGKENKKVKSPFKELKVLKGYLINKNIMRFAFGVCLILLFIAIGWTLKNGSFYISCPEDKVRCFNPFYNNCPVKSWTYNIKGNDINDFLNKYNLCDREFIEGGESYGVKPPAFISDLTVWILLIFVVAFGINHLLYNGGLKVES